MASPRRLTSATISLGVVVAAACFLVAGAAELLGRQPHADGMTDVRTLLDGTLSLDPWAWASLGTFVVVLTPAVALVVTAWEYRSIADHRAMLLALVVLAVLVISAAVAVLGY